MRNSMLWMWKSLGIQPPPQTHSHTQIPNSLLWFSRQTAPTQAFSQALALYSCKVRHTLWRTRVLPTDLWTCSDTSHARWPPIKAIAWTQAAEHRLCLTYIWNPCGTGDLLPSDSFSPQFKGRAKKKANLSVNTSNTSPHTTYTPHKADGRWW